MNPCPPDGPAPVERTWQSPSYATGDDGDSRKGVAWPNPRFTDNGNGTVTDNLTGLIWLKNANCFGTRTWYQALSDCNGLSAGWCGLTDGSVAGDWRLPNRYEFESLLDLGSYNPALPPGNPFYNVLANLYWSSTTDAYDTNYAWDLYMFRGAVYYELKYIPQYVWPVRGGH